MKRKNVQTQFNITYQKSKKKARWVEEEAGKYKIQEERSIKKQLPDLSLQFPTFFTFVTNNHLRGSNSLAG